ncbi:hypothetical protein Tco_0164771 [Tanacetum coccineum]
MPRVVKSQDEIFSRWGYCDNRGLSSFLLESFGKLSKGELNGAKLRAKWPEETVGCLEFLYAFCLNKCVCSDDKKDVRKSG